MPAQLAEGLGERGREAIVLLLVIATVDGQLDLARADMLRRNRLSITGEWVEDAASFAAWLLPHREAPDPELRARYEALAGHILPVIVSWHLGVPLAEPAGSATGALDARKFWVAWNRGDATRGDTFDSAWNFWQHVDQPLAELRAAMGVPPLQPEDGDGGGTVHPQV